MIELDSVKPLDIRNYSDYRTFLKDYFAERHRKHASWSYASWGRQLGLSSASMLVMIVNGQRHPGAKLIERLIRYFKFSAAQEEYFRDLVKLQKKSINPQLTVLLLNQLRDRQAQASPEDILFRRSSYIIRELTETHDFKEDASWIAKRLLDELSPAEITALLEKLLSAGLLGRDSAGKLIPQTATHAASPPPKEKLEQLHLEILNATRDALHSVPAEKRSFNTSFINVRSEKLDEAKKLIDEFQEKFLGLIEERPGHDVYQLNIHFFPVTKPSR